MREQREEGTRDGPDKCINRNRAVGVEPITVDQVAHALPERHHAAQADERDGENLRHPNDMRVAGPGEPEETDGQGNGADDHRG